MEGDTNLFQTLKGKLKNSLEIKNASWLIIGRIVQMLLSFIVSIITTRYLGPQNFGVINYVTAYVTFFSSICSLGINSIIIKDFINNPKEQGKAIGSSILLRVIASIFSTIMIIGIISVVDRGESETILIAFLCSLGLIFQSFDIINYWYQSRYQSKITAIATLVAYIATAIYRVVLIITHRSIAWFALATSIDYIFLSGVLLAFYKKNNGPSFKVSVIKGKELLRQSYHYIISGAMVAIYSQTDKFMLKHMLNETEVGYYSLAHAINIMWVFVLQAIIDSLYPTIMKLHKTDYKAYEKKNRQLYAIIIYISIFVAVCFVALGKWAIVLIYGKEFEAATLPLNIIAWYTIFSYLGVARNAWIVCENNQKYLKYMYFSAAVINVILNFFMIPKLGTSGAALASLLTQILTSMVLPYFIKDMRPNVKLMVDAFLLRGVK